MRVTEAIDFDVTTKSISKKEFKGLEIKAAIIDLYNNEENLGIGAITNLLMDFDGKIGGKSLVNHRYETRYKAEVPDLSYDIYISSGGPGSPFEGEGTVWEKKYFNLLDKL
jgi:hypothetical protein